MARDFDGVNDYIRRTSLGTPDNDTYTVYVWVWHDTVATGPIWHASHVIGSGSVLYHNADGTLTFQTLASGAVSRAVQTSGSISFNHWAFIACVYALTGPELYLGDVRTPITGEPSYSIETSDGSSRACFEWQDFTLGRVGTTYFDGKMGEVGVVRRALSIDELNRIKDGQRFISNASEQVLYWPLDSPNAATIADYSGNGNHPTNSGTTVIEGPPIAFQWGPTATIAHTPTSSATILGIGKAKSSSVANAFGQGDGVSIGKASTGSAANAFQAPTGVSLGTATSVSSAKSFAPVAPVAIGKATSASSGKQFEAVTVVDNIDIHVEEPLLVDTTYDLYYDEEPPIRLAVDDEITLEAVSA